MAIRCPALAIRVETRQTAPLLSRLGLARETLKKIGIGRNAIRAATVMERFPQGANDPTGVAPSVAAGTPDCWKWRYDWHA